MAFALLTFSHWSPFWWFTLLFLFRYARLWIWTVAFLSYRPTQPVDDPKITSKDVTVIIPTVAEDLEQLKETIQTAARQEPHEIILVTPVAKTERVSQMVIQDLGDPKKLRMLSVNQANKRRQLCRAIPEVQTPITLLLDDDVWLPEKFLKWTLAPFEEDKVGGVGTNQTLRRKDWSNIWEFLGAMYLTRRNFDCTACNWVDGGLPCLSGRAVAYRSKILQDPQFTHGFTHETWGSDHFLNADDDNFITRWLFAKGYDIRIQYHRECEVETTLENDAKYLRQCLRWVRSNWRSNITSLSQRHMWMNYPFSVYAVFQTTITQWAFLYDCALFVCFHLALVDLGLYGTEVKQWQRTLLWGLFIGHFALSKMIKLMPYLLRNPADFRFLPVSVCFGYFHNLIKLYGFLTVKETTWGTREGADADDNIRMIPIPSGKSSMTPPPEGRNLRERGAVPIPCAVC